MRGAILAALIVLTPAWAQEGAQLNLQTPPDVPKSDEYWKIEPGKASTGNYSGDARYDGTYTWDAPPATIPPEGFPLKMKVEATTGSKARFATGIGISVDEYRFKLLVKGVEQEKGRAGVKVNSEYGAKADGDLTVTVVPRGPFGEGVEAEIEIGPAFGPPVTYKYKAGKPTDCDADGKAVLEFRENLLPVLRHPRCSNCHGMTDLFSENAGKHQEQNFVGEEEKLLESGWVDCAGCHTASPKDPKAAEEVQWRVMLADDARWAVLGDRSLCARLKKNAQTPDEFVAHIRDDFRVGLGFAGKRGHSDLAPLPPPRTQEQFVAAARRWADAMGGNANWGKPECGCKGLPDNPPARPAKPQVDCQAAVGRVQNALNAQADAMANAQRTACKLKSLPPESRAGRPQAISDVAQKTLEKARQETAAARAAAKDCDTSGTQRPEISSAASDEAFNLFAACIAKADADAISQGTFTLSRSPADTEKCDRLLDELKCDGIRVLRDDPPPVIEDPVITVPDDVKPECREAYRALEAAKIELERAQKYLAEIGRTYSGAGPKGIEIYKSSVARRDRASTERIRAQAALDACGARPGQGEQRGAAIPPLPPGDTPQDWEPDTNRAGPDLDVIELPDADPTACIAECQDYGGCKAFTYVKPGAAGNRAPLCKLKGAIGPATRDPCCVSGLP